VELYGRRANAPKAYLEEVGARFARLRLRHGIGTGQGRPAPEERPAAPRQLALAI
jgi:hypothetical protein